MELIKNKINEIEFDGLVKNKKSILVYFTGTGCSVCKVIYPKIIEMQQEHFPELDVLQINCTDSTELCSKLGIFTVPVLIVYFEGKEFIRKVRNFSIDELKFEIKRPYEMIFG